MRDKAKLALAGLMLFAGPAGATDWPESPPLPDYCEVWRERDAGAPGRDTCLKCRAGYLKDSKGDCRQAGDFGTDRSPRKPLPHLKPLPHFFNRR